MTEEYIPGRLEGGGHQCPLDVQRIANAKSKLRVVGPSRPQTRYLPAIIRFLGYNPLPKAITLAEQLVPQRTSLGLSQKESADCIGVDAGT